MIKENKNGYGEGITKAKKENYRSIPTGLTDERSPVMAIQYAMPGFFI